MRPLGLLGAALSGAPPFAGLGTGSPSASTFLRGDGAWAALSAPFQSAQKFTASGTFTVPAGVKVVAILLIGGGGGNAEYSGPAGNGGDTSFGSYATAPGGTGGGNSKNPVPSLDSSSFVGIGMPIGACNQTIDGTIYGAAGINGSAPGADGTVVFGVCPVTSGQSISVTVGAGGSSSGGGGVTGGTAGVAVVRY